RWSMGASWRGARGAYKDHDLPVALPTSRPHEMKTKELLDSGIVVGVQGGRVCRGNSDGVSYSWSVECGGRRVQRAPSAPKLRKVLGLLLVHVNEVLPVVSILRELWDDEPP